MRQPPTLLNGTTAPETAPAQPHPEAAASYLELYGLSRPPFTGGAEGAGYIVFRSRKRGFDLVVDHIANGTGLMLLQGAEGSGKTETLRSAAAMATQSDPATPDQKPPDQKIIMLARPADGSISLTELIAALGEKAEPDDSKTDQEIADLAIDHFLAPPRKVLLADDIDLMPNECVRLLRSLCQRVPDAPNGPAIVLTTSIDLSDISKRPDLSSFVTLARKTVRIMPLAGAEVRQYIERSLWISGGTTRRLLSPDAMKLLITRSDGMPGAINRLMEAAFTAGFASGDPVITAKTLGAPAPRTTSRFTKRQPSATVSIAVQIVAAGLLVSGVSVFLYKGLGGEFAKPNTDAPSQVPARPVVAAPVPGNPQPAATARPAEPMSAELMTVLMKRGDQSLELGDIVAARLLFRRAADAGNASAATALGRTYDPAFATAGGKSDPAQAAEWYRKAIALGDTRAADLLKRLAGR